MIKVICDESNNPPENVEQGYIKVDIEHSLNDGFDILESIERLKEHIYKNAFNIQPKVVPKDIFNDLVQRGIIDKDGNFKGDFLNESRAFLYWS